MRHVVDHGAGIAEHVFLQVGAGKRRKVAANDRRVFVEYGGVHSAHEHARDRDLGRSIARQQQRHLGVGRPLGVAAIRPQFMGATPGQRKKSGLSSVDGSDASLDDAILKLAEVFRDGFGDDGIAFVTDVVDGDRTGMRVRGADKDVRCWHAGFSRDAVSRAVAKSRPRKITSQAMKSAPVPPSSR